MSVRSSFVAVAELCTETARRWSTQHVNRSLPLKGLSMNIRAASLFVAFAFAALPAHAQGPSTNLTLINARLTALEAAVAAETAARLAADTTLQTNINTEVTNRADAVTAEASARAAADTALQTNINSEAASRGAADTALDARVAKLEGNITEDDLVGTYAIAGIDIPLSGRAPGGPLGIRRATIQTDGFTATLTLNFDRSALFVIGACGSSILTEGFFTLTSEDCGAGTEAPGTWSYTDGTLALSIPDLNFNAPLSVGVGGRLLTTAHAPFHAADSSSDTVIVIGSRLQ